jgi:hypothetical protein
MRAREEPGAKSFRAMDGPAMGIEIKRPSVEEPDLVNRHRSALGIADSIVLHSQHHPIQIQTTKKGTMRLILLIILILLVIGALPTWPYSTGWGYYPSGGLGLLLLIVLLIILLR